MTWEIKNALIFWHVRGLCTIKTSCKFRSLNVIINKAFISSCSKNGWFWIWGARWRHLGTNIWINTASRARHRWIAPPSGIQLLNVLTLDYAECECWMSPLKLHYISVVSLLPSLFETCNCSYFQNYHLYMGCASARLLSVVESNVVRCVCGLSINAPVWIFTVLWNYRCYVLEVFPKLKSFTC